MSWHFWDRVQARGRRKRRRRKRGEEKKKKVGRNKGRREAQEKKKVLFQHHIPVFSFPQPGKHINPSAFTLGNKGTKPDCGGKGDKKDPGTLKRERARSRNSWDSTFRDALRCPGRHRGLAQADSPDRAETTDKWRSKDSQGQLLLPHPTCQEGEKTAKGKKKAAQPSGQDRLWVGGGAFGSRSCSTPPLYRSACKGERGLGGKVFHLGNCPGTTLQFAF